MRVVWVLGIVYCVGGIGGMLRVLLVRRLSY